jgi:hypothetical protein
MFKRRFLLALAVCSIVLISLMISSFAIMNSPYVREFPGSFYQQRITWTGSTQLSNTYYLDCFRRHYKFSHKESASVQQDASNYFLNLS